MALSARAGLSSNKPYKRIARFDGGSIWARLIGITGTIHFSRGDARETDVWTFGAPYWAISIPDANWRALK